jgi:amino acid permease
MYVPYLAMVMSLIGAVLTISISVILPGVLHLKLVHGGKDPSATKFSKAWDYMCIVIGVICAVSGTIAALQGLAAQLALGA